MIIMIRHDDHHHHHHDGAASTSPWRASDIVANQASGTDGGAEVDAA